jgi:protein-tyrosine phosphatase
MNSDKNPLVLFVCTGNQIRSPLSEAIFHRCLNEAGLQESFRVESAGTWTHDGHSDPYAIETARRMGLDIERHRSRVVNKEILFDACLVIVMESGQKEALEVEYPKVRGKVRLLSRLAGESAFNIPDPSGRELAFYFQTGDELNRLVTAAFEKICRILQSC